MKTTLCSSCPNAPAPPLNRSGRASCRDTRPRLSLLPATGPAPALRQGPAQDAYYRQRLS
ncbi:hypothetical protein [Hymenobacter sp. CRA2]|uniref:hypothetical protein n=1 Tax=Hymenobacter sp. CRA2 TaxID=1955620 RepID=UPI0011163739|nr:hypothetical protein [Hymenobacter sp. CRA2]